MINTYPRVVIIGGPRVGKSTLAREMRAAGIPSYCGDPLSKVKDPELLVAYLPEGLSWSEASEYIARNWLTMEGPWVCEGVSLVRALRKALDLGLSIEGIEVIYLTEPKTERSPSQIRMAKAVQTIWRAVEARMKHRHNIDDSAGTTKTHDAEVKTTTPQRRQKLPRHRQLSIRAL